MESQLHVPKKNWRMYIPPIGMQVPYLWRIWKRMVVTSMWLSSMINMSWLPRCSKSRMPSLMKISKRTLKRCLQDLTWSSCRLLNTQDGHQTTLRNASNPSRRWREKPCQPFAMVTQKHSLDLLPSWQTKVSWETSKSWNNPPGKLSTMPWKSQEMADTPADSFSPNSAKAASEDTAMKAWKGILQKTPKALKDRPGWTTPGEKDSMVGKAWVDQCFSGILNTRLVSRMFLLIWTAMIGGISGLASYSNFSSNV